MQDWITQTDRFVAFNERNVLEGAGHISHAHMEEIVNQKFEIFDTARRAAEIEQFEREALEDIAELEGEARRITSKKRESKS